MCISKNGDYLFTADSSGFLIVWKTDEEDLIEIDSFQAHEDYILKVAVSNDLKKVATCSADKTVKLFKLIENREEGEDIKYEEHITLLGHTKWVWDCKFVSNSDYLITVSTDCFLKLWECNSGLLSKNCCQHSKGITTMALYLPGEDDIEEQETSEIKSENDMVSSQEIDENETLQILEKKKSLVLSETIEEAEIEVKKRSQEEIEDDAIASPSKRQSTKFEGKLTEIYETEKEEVEGGIEEEDEISKSQDKGPKELEEAKESSDKEIIKKSSSMIMEIIPEEE